MASKIGKAVRTQSQSKQVQKTETSEVAQSAMPTTTPSQGGEATSEVAVDLAPPIESLSDIITWLLFLEPGDKAELSNVHTALDSFIEQDSMNATARQLLAQVSALIDDVINSRSGDPIATMDEVSNLIGQAEAIQSSPKSTVSHLSETPAAQPASAPVESAQSDLLPEDADLDLIREFITESLDYIEGAEAALLTMEVDPDNQEAVNSVFRAFHTIKGTSGFMGLTRVSELAHRAESILSRVRDRQIQCTGIYADLTLRSIDMLKELMQSVREAVAGKPMDLPTGYEDLLNDLINPESLAVTKSSKQELRLGDILVAQGKVTLESIETLASQNGEDPIGLAAVKSKTASLSDVAKALRTQQQLRNAESGKDSSLRVRTDRLDRLIDMVGELVIAQSMVAQDRTVHQIGNHELLKKVTHSGKIVRELQDLTMSMRMVPLKAAFQKMARLARDLAHKQNRLVNFVPEGEDTEIDRNMVDVISDPLVHMVRNAIDHGIEQPDARLSAGKPETGTLRLSAYHSGGDVIVELQDDGRGLNREKIIEKAIAKGLIDPDKTLPDNEIFDLIFAPGFSTADQITDISGRGVGMDVVKRSVEALRGRIEIASETGKGATFTVRLPLTLAITDGMLVKVGSERYIIPIVNIHLSFRPDASALSSVAGRGELVMLRGELMPIFRLYRLFGIAGAVEDPVHALLVVVGDGARRCALLVDELLGQQQVVAKTLGEGVGRIQGVSGGAILGDGRVGLILDPTEIVAMARQAPSGAGSENQSAA
jgi:two-component system, chemotaxis family, sensor kinase CheA